MKVQTSKLSGAALDWAVCSIEGEQLGRYTRYSTDWAQGGAIIERERISLFFDGFDADDEALPIWGAIHYNTVTKAYGDTPLEAAMRCYVFSKLGDEVEVPDEVA